MSPPRHSPDAYDIRPAKSNEETDLIWSKNMLNLGWDRFGDDLATYMDHSNGRGMLLAFEKGSPQPIGHVSAVMNDNSTAWVAMFIVDEAYRGVGLGGALFKDMLAEASTAEYAGLDAVPEQKATYERRGFVESKQGGIGLSTRPFSAPAPEVSSSDGVVSIRTVSPEILAEYELKHSGFLRLGLWKNLLRRPDMLGWVVARGEVHNADDLQAVGLIRRCPGGSRLGPLYADSTDAAEAVLREVIAASTPGYVKTFPFAGGVKLDTLSEEQIAEKAIINAEVWTGNAAAVPLFEKLGFTQLGLFHRMWLNDKAPPQQSAGGAAETGVFCIFDGAIG